MLQNNDVARNTNRLHYYDPSDEYLPQSHWIEAHVVFH